MSSPQPAADGMTTVDCPLCGSSDRRVVHAGTADINLKHPGRFDIVECGTCATRYLDPMPQGATLAGYYAAKDGRAYPNHAVGSDLHLPPRAVRFLLAEEADYPAAWGDEPSFADMKAARAWIDDPDRRWRVPRWTGEGRLLDVGCGTGSYLAAMQALGWKVTGVDLFPSVADAVKTAHDITVHAGELPDVDLPEGGFDVVTLWHTIEHMPDPAKTIARARDLLAPGGFMLVGVPVYDCEEERLLGGSWLGYDVPRHLFTFSRERLRSFLAEQGLQVEWLRSEPAPWILREGLKTVPVGLGKRLLLKRKGFREWYARRLAARDRSGKVVAMARRP